MKLGLTDKERPIFNGELLNGETVSIMLDTGAMYPVWTRGIEYLKEMVPNLRDEDCSITVGGFGGDGELCKIYTIPIIRLTEDFEIQNLPVAVCTNEKIKTDIVLSSNIFKKWKMVIDYMEGYLEVNNDSNYIYCAIKRHPYCMSSMHRFYTFTLEDEDWESVGDTTFD